MTTDPYSPPNLPDPVPPPTENAIPTTLRRLMGWFVDTFVLMVVGQAVVFVFFGVAIGVPSLFGWTYDPENPLMLALTLLSMVITLVISLPLTWEVLFQLAVSGQTPSRVALDLVVVDMAGHPPSRGRMFARAVVKHTILMFAAPIAVLIYFNAQHRAPWDYLLGTRVIHLKRPKLAAPPRPNRPRA